MAASEGEKPSTRRQFGKAVALLAAAPLAVPSPAVADDKPKEIPAPVAVSEALAEVVRTRHGKRLSREQMKQVKRSILRSQRSAERLRKFKLDNADEPAFTFRAD